jgi:hypothetical protein
VDNRYYLQALGVTGLFVTLLILFWIASGGPASEAAVQNANDTRTAIAMTGSYLLQPRTRTPLPITSTPTSLPQTSIFGGTSTIPSATNTSLLPQPNIPISPVAASLTPLPTQTAAAQLPVLAATATRSRENTKAPPLAAQSATPTFIQIFPQSSTPTGIQGPAEFARWYFTRVWNERDYQNLWDNYLTPSYKTNVGSGLFEDYVGWWDSVQQVDVNGADVLENNGRDAWVRVNLTFHMRDGRVVVNQVYDYDFLFDPSRGTWMFDASP